MGQDPALAQPKHQDLQGTGAAGGWKGSKRQWALEAGPGDTMGSRQRCDEGKHQA